MDDKMICFGCINDAYLVKHIKRTGVSAECSICSKKRKAIPIDGLVSMVENVLESYFSPGAEYLIRDDNGKISHSEQRGDPLTLHVAELLELDEDDPVVEYVLAKLTYCSHYEAMQGGEAKYSDEINYVLRRIQPREAEHRWEEFKLNIKHGNRFFNKDAKAFLDWLFMGVDSFKVWDGSKTVVRELVDEPIFRARRCDSTAEYEAISKDTAKQLGVPPKERAGSGRMNPSGVPAFYGAFERKTCIAELRPPVGGRVVSGEFKLRRPVRALDFITLDKAHEAHPISIFDPTYTEKMGRRRFLQTLHSKISIPVLPDQEHEYLVTQVIAEYLATQYSPPIDGVLFESVQVESGTNLTLFNHAVIALDTPFIYIENLDKMVELSPPQNVAIEYVADSLMLHSIKRVKYKTHDLSYNDNQPESADYDEHWDDYPEWE